MGYFSIKLRRRLDELEDRGLPSWRICWKLMKWLPREFLRLSTLHLLCRWRLKKNCDRLAFVLTGGIGDIVIAGPFIERFISKLSSNAQVCLIGPKVVKVLYAGKYANLYAGERIDFWRYDLVIELGVFPMVLFRGKERFCDEFLDRYLDILRHFSASFPSLANCRHPPAHLSYLDAVGRNRVSGLDVGGLLQINNESLWDLSIPPLDERNFYDRFPFAKNKFITIGRGVDLQNKYSDSIRLWSPEQYNRWISIFKDRFPHVVVVQLGVSKSRCVELDADVDLVGRTTLLDILYLLQRSKFHVDGECGYVHLRHFLTKGQGRSLVLFGPTSERVKGYRENFNLSNRKGCSLNYPCEWILGDGWQKKCIHTGSATPLCMQNLEPDCVMKRVVQYLESEL